MDVLNGRPTALEAEFPLSNLKLEGNLLPMAVGPLLNSSEKVRVSVPEFASPRPGVFSSAGTIYFGSTAVPMDIEVENVSLPSGNTAFLTARVELKIAQRDLTRVAAERRLDALHSGNGLQLTLWFMAKAEQQQAEMMA